METMVKKQRVLVYYPSYRYSLERMALLIGPTYCPSYSESPTDFAWIDGGLQGSQFEAEFFDSHVVTQNIDPQNIEAGIPDLSGFDILIIAERVSRYRCYPPMMSVEFETLVKRAKERGMKVINSTWLDIPGSDVSIGAGYHRILSHLLGKTIEYDFTTPMKFDKLEFSRWHQNELLEGIESTGNFGIWFSSYGCPYVATPTEKLFGMDAQMPLEKKGCSYCGVHLMTGASVRRMPIETFDSAIQHMVKKKMQTVYLIDETFTLYPDWAKKVADVMQKHQVNWEVQTRIDKVNPEILKYMAERGCTEVGYGAEHINPELLKQNDKFYTKQQIIDSLKMTKDAGMKAVMFVILGMPGDTPENYEELVHFFEEHGGWIDGYGAQLCTPLKNTKLYEMGVKEGKIKTDEDMPLYAGTIGNKYTPEEAHRMWYDFDTNVAKPGFLGMFGTYYAKGVIEAYRKRWGIEDNRDTTTGEFGWFDSSRFPKMNAHREKYLKIGRVKEISDHTGRKGVLTEV